MIDSIKLWMRVRAFMAAIHRELREGHSVVILYEVGSSTSGKVFREMRNPAFRERVMIQDNHCQNVSCRARQKPELADTFIG